MSFRFDLLIFLAISGRLCDRLDTLIGPFMSFLPLFLNPFVRSNVSMIAAFDRSVCSMIQLLTSQSTILLTTLPLEMAILSSK